MINGNLKKIISIVSYLIAFMYAISFAHSDCYYAIVPWGLDFISIMKQGNMFHFYQLENGVGIYNILIILISALWLLPFNIFTKLIGVGGKGRNIIIYTIWYKMLLVTVLIISSHYLGVLLKKLGIDEDKVWLGKLLYIISPLVLMNNIGMGQIDVIAVLFVIIAMNFCVDKKYVKMCILFGIAASFKYHAVFLIIPLLLILEKRVIYLMRYLIICISIPVLVEMISRIDPYYNSSKNSTVFFVDYINYAYFNHISVYLVLFALFCIMCYYMNTPKDVRLIIVVPAISFLMFLTFVPFHPQWIIYIVPFIVIMLVTIEDEFMAILLNLGISIGFILYQIAVWVKAADNYMTAHGIFRLVLRRTADYNGIPLANIICPRDFIGKTIMLPCMVSLFIIFLNEIINDKKHNTVNSKSYFFQSACIGLIPSVLFLIASISMYCLNI